MDVALLLGYLHQYEVFWHLNRHFWLYDVFNLRVVAVFTHDYICLGVVEVLLSVCRQDGPHSLAAGLASEVFRWNTSHLPFHCLVAIGENALDHLGFSIWNWLSRYFFLHKLVKSPGNFLKMVLRDLFNCQIMLKHAGIHRVLDQAVNFAMLAIWNVAGRMLDLVARFIFGTLIFLRGCLLVQILVVMIRG